MNGEDAVVTQLGLLLTQVRYSRMALENIERATTRYAGIAVSVPGATAGAALGAPPLLDGALKVHVVNIGDLTAGMSLGEVISGAIGGAGRFLGGFFGGLVGGTVSSVAFPWTLTQVARITEAVGRILPEVRLTAEAVDRISARLSGPTPAEAAATSAASDAAGMAETLRRVAEIFGAGAAAPAGPPERLQGVLDVITAIRGTVDGLILLLPIAIGFIASFVTRLDDIELAIVDLLAFALRNILLLRAALFALVLDTLALAGRLAASVVGLVATAADTVLASVFSVIHSALQTVFTALEVAALGLKETVDALMVFLRDGVGALLVWFGTLRVFQLVFHLAQVLPAVLPAVARIAGKPLTPGETTALSRAAALAPPSGGGTPTSWRLAPFPDLASTILPPTRRAALESQVDDLARTLRRETETSLVAVDSALSGMATTMQGAATRMDTELSERWTQRVGTARRDADALASALRSAEEVSRRHPGTGLEAIAAAYEAWLREGGLTTLMQQITRQFREGPTGSAEAGATVPGRVVTAVAESEGDRRVMVEIGEVTIDLVGEGEGGAGSLEGARGSFDPDAYLEWRESVEDRGGLVPV